MSVFECVPFSSRRVQTLTLSSTVIGKWDLDGDRWTKEKAEKAKEDEKPKGGKTKKSKKADESDSES